MMMKIWMRQIILSVILRSYQWIPHMNIKAKVPLKLSPKKIHPAQIFVPFQKQDNSHT